MRLADTKFRRMIRNLILEFGAENYEGGSNDEVEMAIEEIAMIISMDGDMPGFGKGLSDGGGRGQMETAGIRLSKKLRQAGAYGGELEHDMVLSIVEYIFREDRGGKYYSKAPRVLANLHAAGFTGG